MTNDAKLVLYHHPHSRAAAAVWMLEEVGVPYELRHVDLRTGAQKAPELIALNPMGKVPTLVDGGVVITESAAIGLYLADRYAPGRLAPPIDAPARGTYLRWSLFAPSVIEPGSVAKARGWDIGAGTAGWGDHAAMLATIEHALAPGPWLLGEQFTMADVIFGGTVRFMIKFGMMEARPSFTAYVDRLNARPTAQAADAKNAAALAGAGGASS